MGTVTKPARKVETVEELADLVKDLEGPFEIVVKALSEDGDERLAWDPRDLAQLKEARDKFYELLDSGHAAFAVSPRTGEADTRKKIIRFQPDAGEIIFTFKEAVEQAKAGRKTVARPAVAAG